MIQAPKGTKDIFGDEMRVWRRLEIILREIADTYGFHEIRTPVIEHTELFVRGVGDTTDIVQKEMYSFNDKAGRGLSLRPELTAGAARAYVEHGMHNFPQPIKLFYIGPNFRYENPQAGRYRQHHQFGVEIFGAPGAAAEAEIISVGNAVVERLGIQNVELNINSIGCPKCRADYKNILKNFIGDNYGSLCGTCRERLEKNVLRALDCKVEGCRALLANAPSVLDSLDEDCRKHFESVKSTLRLIGVPFKINPKIVRGLDYYTRTVFEFIDDGGAGLTVIGGGRYDGLIAEVGGAPTPGAGFGMGLERLALSLKKRPDDNDAGPRGPEIFLGHAGEEGFTKSQELAYKLRKEGISAEYETIGRSVKAQMKYADKTGARFACIVGDDEIKNGEVKIKNMATGETAPCLITCPSYLTDFIKNK